MKYESRAPLFTVLAALTLAAISGGQAHAYCRTYEDAAPTGPCMEDPSKHRLVWAQSCARYAFNEDFFARMPLLTEKAIRTTFDDAFEAWADVDCDGRAPFFVEQLSATTADRTGKPVSGASKETVMVARTGEEWIERKIDSRVLALTSVWYDPNDGTIYDADIEFNTGAGSFDDCVKNVCGSDKIDLKNTITHEAGHLLGLGHSPIDGSTMLDGALVMNETEKRSLEADDRAGYCALALPEFTCTTGKCSCAPPKSSSGTHTSTTCSVVTPGSTHGARGTVPALLVGFVLSAWARVRRRSR